MWPFKKKVPPRDTEVTFSETVIISGASRPVVAGIQETGRNSGLYLTWIRVEIPNLPMQKLHLGGLPMPRTQATKAAMAIGQGMVNHLLVQKKHLESVADD